MMLRLTHRLPANPDQPVNLSLPLTAEERTRSRYRLEHVEGQVIELQLPRGTVLLDGDLLQNPTGNYWVRIVARPEPVLTVSAMEPIDLLRAAYHLGNRHVSLELTPHYLRLAFDQVLQHMLEKLGLHVKPEIAPFHPEKGAYHHH